MTMAILKPAALVSSEPKDGLHQQGTKFVIGSLHAHVCNWISSRLCILTEVITPIDSEKKGYRSDKLPRRGRQYATSGDRRNPHCEKHEIFRVKFLVAPC